MSPDVFSVPYSDKSAEQLHDIRYVGHVPGCYSLSQLSERKEEGTIVFACRTKSISTRKIEIDGPVRGEVGEAISLKLTEFDIILGKVCQVTETGMVVDVEASEDERTQIAGTIDWIKKNRFRAVKDKRESNRIVLAQPRSAIVLADGRIVECFIIDVSGSGAAVSADLCLKVGTPLAVGSAVAVVARNLELGFAVKFVEPLDLEQLEDILGWSLEFLGTSQSTDIIAKQVGLI